MPMFRELHCIRFILTKLSYLTASLIRKYQEVSQLCQSLQAAESSCSEHIIKIKVRSDTRLLPLGWSCSSRSKSCLKMFFFLSAHLRGFFYHEYLCAVVIEFGQVPDFSPHLWQELERRLTFQEQDIAIVKTVKLEVARLPDMEKELKRLREDNAFLRWNPCLNL